ncbi:MAG TPA: hypothetical protein VL572_12845 [Pyrinomonadaceae bacterium]|nr:hypothetical protein [Pyrinomonadaceae bacterium]
MNDVLFELHLTVADLENGVEHVLASPGNNGTVEMIVARPEVNKRTVLTKLSLIQSLASWATTGSTAAARGRAMGKAIRKCS